MTTDFCVLFQHLASLYFVSISGELQVLPLIFAYEMISGWLNGVFLLRHAHPSFAPFSSDDSFMNDDDGFSACKPCIPTLMALSSFIFSNSGVLRQFLFSTVVNVRCCTPLDLWNGHLCT